MAFELPALPFEPHALAPGLSADRVRALHEGRQRACLERLNGLLDKSAEESPPLEALMQASSREVAELATEAWTLTFYWHCLAPWGGGQPQGTLATAIDSQFGSFCRFRDALSNAAGNNRSSAWSWLVRDHQGSLAILDHHTPLTAGYWPVLVIESALSHHCGAPCESHSAYRRSVWDLLNWSFIEHNYS
ncbi:hypothetical protein OM427_20250 [Halomonas sp. 18H]|uniref:Fe-Mn family superoxide dismutase n=1 Tax=Halomonas almeriensis TaxID=308163 RepID=UPI00223243A3|nr:MULTISPECIES: Fe-Mn family superoxide dismutase [Halomonas]MCW4151853.1 hypothetical protein [Halomonas sp. 18H]MDN3554099.1 Fe-Mn family superoxide dismutase [Halomonas almeriensis]